MSIPNIGPGPDGLFMITALIVSFLVTILTWRRVPLSVTALVTAVVAGAMALWLVVRPETTRDVLVASFVIVPTGLLLAISRIGWIVRHAWILALAGPALFVGCYTGICEVCWKAGLIS